MKKINSIDFGVLVKTIQEINGECIAQASRAVNVSLTLRNWCIGAYIHEYELNGSDRAQYGEKLIEKLSPALKSVPRTQKRELNRYRLFYKTYPQIGETVPPQLKAMLNSRLLSMGEKEETTSPQFTNPADLLARLSFSHFDLLFSIGDDTKRGFYEIEAIRGNWSVRELKRQINSLYYERSGLSLNKEKLAELTQQGVEKQTPQLTVRDPYVFEFLGLKSREVMSESHLEEELLDKIQEFLLEMGHGFCFEARQKRILIGNTHNFVDLVFIIASLNVTFWWS